MRAAADAPDARAAFRFAAKLGFISFGGPAGQIAILHRELVAGRRWIGEDEFARALNFCMLLPGPEALQLVIWLGWRWFGIAGGLVAGLCFLGPATLILALLSWIYVRFGTLVPVAAALAGLKAVVVALVLQALTGIGRRALKGVRELALAAAAFAAIAWLHWPFPLVIGAAALAGLVAFRDALPPARAGAGRPARPIALLAGGALLWLLPLALLAIAAPGTLPLPLYLFFSKVALVGFGGAYAVLSYVNQELVGHLGWLSPPDLVAGLALAETTPGPLVLVLEFYGYVAGYRAPGPLAPGTAGLLGAALATFATFLPSFVLVMALAPWVERLAAQPRLAAALAAVTAAVVGVIASFALAVGLAVLWPAGAAHPDLVAVAIAAGAWLLLTRTRLDLTLVLALGALAGLVARALGAA
ncbi:MAG: chromate efflux transporter [Proteobacteria bacterium]|nr:chromate efflux transporter [Pseudomonadota bacterium]